MTSSDTIAGEIIGLRDYGSIVLVFVDKGDGNLCPVPFDHRAFQWLLEGEGCSPTDLAGRRVIYNGDNLRFIE
jgi:hypothetical protein